MKTFAIPEHWTPRQALAYLDLLENIQRAIWETYHDPLVELIVSDTRSPKPPDDPSEPLDPDDDIPW